MSFQTLPLSGGGLINGPVHGSKLHIDYFPSGQVNVGPPVHIPYAGQTTLDMFTGGSTLGDQLMRINTYKLGSFRAIEGECW